MLPDKLQTRLGIRHFSGSLRSLQVSNNLIDFSSNDYLGFSNKILQQSNQPAGATGSRLITGHSSYYEDLERKIAQFHRVEDALIFNSGYDANIGLISCLTDRSDLILYDQYVHASIRDGIRLSHAKALKFYHNDLDHLEILLSKFSQAEGREVYVITEAVFSMDGDQPDLERLVALCQLYNNVHLILDEAHSIGVTGDQGEGLAQKLGLESNIFARVVTFGKALGSHGAAILGSTDLKEYLINYARSLIYTTALPQHSLKNIAQGYQLLQTQPETVHQLQELISVFNKLVVQNGLRLRFRESDTAIQACIIKDNSKVKRASQILQENGFDVRPIFSPTVPKGEERLRICLHAFNTSQEIEQLLQILSLNIKRL
ncbi:aminotransferase class I/II-fold pyridoxal phosphate-dependent enzyme [Nonlabens xiamenensis]|uniref:aminotransferase class I/II-fold pyridoxal phosphate-dependent enzyme n=1 Tax=Nonlabens xiamenensis TaxID=2341043 RepID=UPI000F60F9C1|nr:pyridoxal phosphate-dependent aminotransferase family protein [Nonlabens xiamenensis]